MKRTDRTAWALLVLAAVLLVVLCYTASCRRVRRAVVKEVEDTVVDKAVDKVDTTIDKAVK